MAYLMLVRHGESAWNQKGWWTGITDVDLTEKGIEEAKKAGKLLRDIHIDYAYTSLLRRAQDTLTYILRETSQESVSIERAAALNERDYGIYTGKNKWEIQKQVGDATFLGIRRGWDVPIPEGESLKDVYDRVVPYYTDQILPKIKEGKNILIAAHGNSLRALIKCLEHVPDDQISSVELKTGEAVVYEIDSSGVVLKKEIRS